MRSRLIKALNNRSYVKFMQLEIGLLAATAGPSCGEIGLNSQNKNWHVSLEYITKFEFWMGKLDCVNANIFHHTQENLK